MSRDEGGRKLSRDIFAKELAPHLESERDRQIEPRASNFILPDPDFPSTVFLGDLHAPFQHVGAVNFAIEVIRELKPKRVVQMGDLYDLYSWSKYPRSHNLFTPKDELTQAKAAALDLWQRVQGASPGVECIQILGNHDLRPYKATLESNPALELLINLEPHYQFPGVTLMADHREELNLGGVFALHGYRTKLGDHRDFMNACAVVGHTHRGGTSFRGIWGGHQIWELNAGVLGDPQAKGLSYTPQRHTQSTLGLGYVDRFGPRFIPYRPASSV